MIEDSIMITKEKEEAEELLKEKFAKESKKITRIPFYKLEELKKIEEKKLKNIHKFKKKEREENIPKPRVKFFGKKLKKTKKQKDEATKQNTKPADTPHPPQEQPSTETNIIKQDNSISSIKKQQNIKRINTNTNSISNSTYTKAANYGDRMHELKYSTSIPHIPRRLRIRLSKKQQRLQNPENSLENFLTAEDKAIIANLVNNIKPNSNSKKEESEMKQHKKKNKDGGNNNVNVNNSGNKNHNVNGNVMMNKKIKFNFENAGDFFNHHQHMHQHDSNSITNNKSVNNLSIGSGVTYNKSEGHFDNEKHSFMGGSSNNNNNDNNINNSNHILQLNNESKELKQEDKTKHKGVNVPEYIHKKRKRFTKYKKAIYKYRLEKKKFLYDTIFNNDNTITVPQQQNQPTTTQEQQQQPLITQETIIPPSNPNIPPLNDVNAISTIDDNNKQHNTAIPHDVDVDVTSIQPQHTSQTQHEHEHKSLITPNDTTNPVINYYNNNNSYTSSSSYYNNNNMNYYYPYFSYMNNYVYPHPFYPLHLSNDDPYTFQSYINTYNNNTHHHPHPHHQQHTNNITNVTHSYGNYINKAQLNKIINKPVSSLDLIQFNPKNKFSFELIKLKPPLTTTNNNNTTLNAINNTQQQNNLTTDNTTEHISILDLQKKYGNANSSTFTFEKIIHSNNNSKEQKSSKLTRKVSFPAKDSNSNSNSNTTQPNPKQFELFKEYLKSTYHLEDIDIKNLTGKDLTEYLHQHKDIDKINFNQLQTFIPEDIMKKYLNEFEGLQNPSQKKIVREYVDQVLDKNLDNKFAAFIEKLRDIYYRKKANAPLKAKKRFVVGMREIEKYIKLGQVLCLFVVPNIEKVINVKNALDERVQKIFVSCKNQSIPIFFGLNKFKLGNVARKKMSCVSMLGFINVEGFENDLKALIECGEKLRKEWYIKHYDKKEEFRHNSFISFELFEIYNTPNNNTNNSNNNDV